MKREFGSDGMRGLYDPTGEISPIHARTAEDLALAYTSMVAEVDGVAPIVVVGGDTRPSTPDLARAAASGASAAGAEVWNVGVVPTPVAAWIAKSSGAHAIVVTASHNQASDNGLKVFAAGGIKPNRDTLQEIERRLRLTEPAAPVSWMQDGGRVLQRPELVRDYVSHTVRKLGGSSALDGTLIVVDGANGAARNIAPALYERLGAKVVRYACECQGINDGCGAAHLEGVQAFLDQRPEITGNPAFIGAFASDGDGDRVMGVDNQGRIINGNHWMQWLARDESQRGIVGTLYTNSATRQAIEASGVEFHECANGDDNVTAKLFDLTTFRGPGYSRDGEFTGHIIDTDHLPSGDGIYMGAALAVDLARNGGRLADTYDGLTLWPELLQNIRLDGNDARTIRDNPAVQEAVAVVAEKYRGVARVVLRASGTEPLIRVWAEAREAAIVTAIVSQLSHSVQLAAETI